LLENESQWAPLQPWFVNSPQVLNLQTTTDDPSVHYHQVRESWFGIRTLNGR
jgi:hypothetical protein